MLRRISFFAGLVKPRLCPKPIFSQINLVRHSSALPKPADTLSITNPNVQKYLESIRVEFYALKVGENLTRDQRKRMRMLSDVVELVEQRNVLLKNISSLNDMKDEKDEEMMALVKEEREVYSEMLTKMEEDIIQQLFEMDDSEDYESFMLEIAAGVGGQEAMLFANEMFDMYTKFCLYKGWQCEILSFDESDVGGCRHACLLVTGDDAFRCLRLEGGVHRVQRVPATEKSGRIHTSTVSVAIIPRPDDLNIDIQEKDLKIETKRSSGAGGQSVNTTDSAVRVVHLPTGIAVENQTERSQHKNKELAIRRLKARLIQAHIEKQSSEVNSSRKSQVGTSNRNEKIRTYNFNQDRITDHRIEGGTVHNLKGFLNGGHELETIISRVNSSLRRKHLMEIIRNMK
ncbi:peptide chain release factor 1-like, mitochondrial [Culicoides brevitarsis]|uniref:peptide chain release factor 1-like, mitochondrial n=1 Tax=Culicoides brevitarsis TaxID=469753 RepID=UPI00307B3788